MPPARKPTTVTRATPRKPRAPKPLSPVEAEAGGVDTLLADIRGIKVVLPRDPTAWPVESMYHFERGSAMQFFASICEDGQLQELFDMRPRVTMAEMNEALRITAVALGFVNVGESAASSA